jgi:hypothetical protein
LGFVALLIGLPLGFALYQGYAARRDLDNVLAELDATDPGWRLEEFEAARKVLPDDQNSAVLVLRLYGKLGGFSTTAGSTKAAPFDDLLPQARLNGEQRQLLRELFGPLAAVRAEALQLKDLPEGRFPITYTDNFFGTLIPHVQKVRHVIQVLQYDAYLRADEGDMTGALQICRAGLNTSRSLAEEPFLISLLVRIAGQAIALGTLERVLAQGEGTDAELQALQVLLQAEIRDRPLFTAMRGERGGGDQMFRGVAAGKIRLSELGLGGGPNQAGGWQDWLLDHMPLNQSQNHAAYLRTMTEMAKISQQPLHEQIPAMANIQKRMNEQPMVARLLLPAVAKVAEANCRIQARLRNALVAVAAERYRLRHKAWPETPAALVRDGLLEEVPADPYDGQPLRWRLVADGVTIYSIGPDLTDNGGIADRQNPLAPNTDLVFRLWHATARWHTLQR